MKPYERVVWQTDFLETMLGQMHDEIESRAGSELAEELVSMGRESGAMNACLARCHLHEPRIGGTAPQVIGKMIGILHEHFPRKRPKELATMLLPLLRWDYGFAGVSEGIETVGDDALGTLLRGFGSVTSCMLEAVWAIGLLSIGGSRDDANRAGEMLRVIAEKGPKPGRTFDGVQRLCNERFALISQDLLQASPLPDHLSEDKIWRNALVMGHYHRDHPEGRPGVFAKLLEHTMDGGHWPLPCNRNDELQPWDQVTRFRTARLTMRQPTSFGQLTLKFISHPLQILNLGNAFDTCLRCGGENERLILGWATNVNIRIVVAKAEDRRTLARQGIALARGDNVGVGCFPSFPEGEGEVDAAFEAFVQEFIRRSALEPVRGAAKQVDHTCAPAYAEAI